MILGLDTATEHIRLALVEGERVWTRTVPGEKGRSHSLVLLPALQAMLREAGRDPGALTGVACCVGPGGFTGLRTGVATAEGLALAGLPTWGFSSFALWAEALHLVGAGRCYWILLDGQRGEAFAQRWVDGHPEAALRVPLPRLQETLGAECWWAPPTFAGRLPLPSAHRFLLDEDAPRAEDALVSLTRRLSQEPPESPLVPFYLRETDAEAHFPEASAHLPEAHRRGLPR
ncbi:MAG: tRNA (adenosine(37)-N6)-threonylcarbamoyltransferase complex dimerization subunit type 1 TsaB [Acidobacteria bacterium]|nr:tRNA (adenosine(37)-N6)-threonylcarbamoyltransferase complex dimerization subunit type 1 TsaB [Acidobacteriota bacterium]